MNGSSENKSNFGGSVRSIFFAFLRVIVALMAMVILLLAAYFGVVYLYQQVIQPIQDSGSRMDALETQLQTQRDQIEERLAQFNERLTVLESKSDLRAEDLDELWVEMEALQAAVTDQALDIEKVEQLESAVSYLATQVMAQQMRSLTATPTPTPFDWEEANQAYSVEWLRNDVEVLKALLLMDRARADLLQNNPEQAIDQMRAANAVLAALSERGGMDPRLVVIPRVTRRLGLALEDASISTVLMAEDLDSAWRLLVNEFIITEESRSLVEGDEFQSAGEQTEIPTFTPTPTIHSTVTPTVTRTPVMINTPTPN